MLLSLFRKEWQKKEMHYTMLRYSWICLSTWCRAIAQVFQHNSVIPFLRRSTKLTKVSTYWRIKSLNVKIAQLLLLWVFKYRERKITWTLFQISSILTAPKCPMSCLRKWPRVWSILVRVCIKITCKPVIGFMEILLNRNIDCRFLHQALNIIWPVALWAHLMSINEVWNALIAQKTQNTASVSKLVCALKDCFIMLLKTNVWKTVKLLKYLIK